MKKNILCFISLLMLVGCSTSGVYQPFINVSDKVVLVDESQEVLDILGYDDLTTVSNVGFIVSLEDDVAFITKRGEITIPYGKYDSLINYGSIIVGTIEDKTYLLNAQGNIVHNSNSDEILLESGLPIIKVQDDYIVYDLSYNILIQTSEVIFSAYFFEETHMIVNFEDSSLLFYQGGTVDGVEISLGQYYGIYGYYSELGHLLVDNENKKLAMVHQGEVLFIENVDILDEYTKIYFDSDFNIVLDDGQDVHLYSSEGVFIDTLNSYYNSSNRYVIENSEYVYGPHLFYFDGKEYEVTGVQLDPFASYTFSEFIPVFVNGERYTYYDFKGNQIIDSFFDEAFTFDQNGRAIVRLDSKVYLIDEEGNFITSSYKKIETLGTDYYIGFITDNQYVILDMMGNQIIEDIFMGNKNLLFSDGNVYGVFTKSARTLVYNLDTFALVFETPGIATLYNDTYLLINDTYYTVEGRKVWEQ